MKISLVLTALLIRLIIGDELQTDKQPTENSTRKQGNGKGNRNPWERETKDDICKEAINVFVQSVYVGKDFIQFFIENSQGSRGWSSVTTSKSGETNPSYIVKPSLPHQLGKFNKMTQLPDKIDKSNDGQFKRVSASFVLFSNGPKEFGYLCLGLNAYEFVVGGSYYQPTGEVKSVTNFLKEGDQKLLKPEDTLEEAVSVSLIKWVEKDKIKDHAIYKIILKTVTKKLLKAYFKLNSNGEVISLNNEPFLPSPEISEDADELNLLEESALYYVGDQGKLSMGYQFISSLAFPIYYDYNPEKNTYKEYPMRTEKRFNEELKALVDQIQVPYMNRYIVPTETWLGCPDHTFCFGRPFDAVFFTNNKYYALFGGSVYTSAFSRQTPVFEAPLKSIFPGFSVQADAAFTLGTMVFIIEGLNVSYKNDIGDAQVHEYSLKDVFPLIDSVSDFPVSAVITLDKEKKASENNETILQPSDSNNATQRTFHSIHERAANTTEEDIPQATEEDIPQKTEEDITQKTEEDIPQKTDEDITQTTEEDTQTTDEDIPQMMVYLYYSSNGGGKVNQYEMETKNPPKFKLIANKTYNEVNAALPMDISLVFTAEGRVVTMVHHFMTVQSSQNFFTQTASLAKFTLVDKYFGCRSETFESKVTIEFIHSYVDFAGPKPGPVGTQETTDATESTPEDKDIDMSSASKKPKTEETHSGPDVNNQYDKGEVKGSAMSAQKSTASFIIQAVVITLFVQIIFK